MAADGGYLAGGHTAGVEQGERRVAKIFAHLPIETAKLVDRFIVGSGGRFLQGETQRFRVGLGVLCEDFHTRIAEAHERRIDSVHAGAGHQADEVIGHRALLYVVSDRGESSLLVALEFLEDRFGLGKEALSVFLGDGLCIRQ